MSWLPYISMFLLMMVGLLLIFIILLQRGRGGGLAGALGGMGGQSAFGTKAGDVFTKITVVLAIIWVALAAGNVFALRMTGTKFQGGSAAIPSAPDLKGVNGLGDMGLGDEPDFAPVNGDPAAATPANKASEATTAQPKEPQTPAAPETPAANTDASDAAPSEPKLDGQEAPAEVSNKPE